MTCRRSASLVEREPSRRRRRCICRARPPRRRAGSVKPAERAIAGNGVSIEEQLGKVADTASMQELTLQHRITATRACSASCSGVEDRPWTSARPWPSPRAAWTRRRPPARHRGEPGQPGHHGVDAREPTRIAARWSPSRTGSTRRSAPTSVRVKRSHPIKSPLPQRYDPSHPAADAQGYVRTSNVNSFIEVMDMREAQRELQRQPERPGGDAQHADPHDRAAEVSSADFSPSRRPGRRRPTRRSGLRRGGRRTRGSAPPWRGPSKAWSRRGGEADVASRHGDRRRRQLHRGGDGGVAGRTGAAIRGRHPGQGRPGVSGRDADADLMTEIEMRQAPCGTPCG